MLGNKIINKEIIVNNKNSRFGVRLLSFSLGNNLSSDHKFADIVRLVKVEETADLGSTLGTEAMIHSKLVIQKIP